MYNVPHFFFASSVAICLFEAKVFNVTCSEFYVTQTFSVHLILDPVAIWLLCALSCKCRAVCRNFALAQCLEDHIVLVITYCNVGRTWVF